DASEVLLAEGPQGSGGGEGLARRQLQTGAEPPRQCPELGVRQARVVDEAGEGPRLRGRGGTGRTCGGDLADAGGAGIAAADLGHGSILDGIVSAESDEDVPGEVRVQRDSEARVGLRPPP